MADDENCNVMFSFYVPTYYYKYDNTFITKLNYLLSMLSIVE